MLECDPCLAVVPELLDVCPEAFAARIRGEPLPLSPVELRLLAGLACRPNRPVAREVLFEEVWGRAMPAGDRNIDAHVVRLRRKLRDALPGWRFIHTQFGVGYRLSPEQIDNDSSTFLD